MWAQPFNHLAAIAAAKEKATELHTRERMLVLAKFAAVANRDELTKKLLLLQIRQRGLERFIDDPYPSTSLLHIGFERDRRAVLEAGMPLQGPALA